MSVVIGGVTHLMFHGIGVADSTACGLIADEDHSRGGRDIDCMACIAYEAQSGPVEYIPGKYRATIQLSRIGKP